MMNLFTMVRRTSLLCVLCAFNAGAQVFRGAASEAPASAEKDRLVFRFPLPDTLSDRTESPRKGYFMWRVTVPTLRPFRMVIISDSAVSTAAAPEEIVRVSRVRMCANAEMPALACTNAVDATIAMFSDHFRVTIRDAELVARVRRDRPTAYDRHVVYPGGRYRQTQHPFWY